MTPLLEAIAVYDREDCARSFNEDLSWHLEHGFVFSRPDFFIMGRPVPHLAGERLITSLRKFHSADCDCWHIWLMAGNVSPAFKIMPWPLKWVSFERKNELRFYRMENIHRLSGANLSK